CFVAVVPRLCEKHGPLHAQQLRHVHLVAIGFDSSNRFIDKRDTFVVPAEGHESLSKRNVERCCQQFVGGWMEELQGDLQSCVLGNESTNSELTLQSASYRQIRCERMG